VKIYSQNRNFDKKRDKFNFGSIFYLVLFARDYGTLSEILNLPLTLIKYDLTPLNLARGRPMNASLRSTATAANAAFSSSTYCVEEELGRKLLAR